MVSYTIYLIDPLIYDGFVFIIFLLEENRYQAIAMNL